MFGGSKSVGRRPRFFAALRPHGERFLARRTGLPANDNRPPALQTVLSDLSSELPITLIELELFETFLSPAITRIGAGEISAATNDNIRCKKTGDEP
jgi:hypothetical protein